MVCPRTLEGSPLTSRSALGAIDEMTRPDPKAWFALPCNDPFNGIRPRGKLLRELEKSGALVHP